MGCSPAPPEVLDTCAWVARRITYCREGELAAAADKAHVPAAAAAGGPVQTGHCQSWALFGRPWMAVDAVEDTAHGIALLYYAQCFPLARARVMTVYSRGRVQREAAAAGGQIGHCQS